MKNENAFITDLLSKKQKDRAFNKLLDLYQERLYWHIRKLVLTHENADDVLQNTFIKIYNGLPKFKQQSSLHTWMYRIAYNESLRFLERDKKRYSMSIDELNQAHIENLLEDAYFNADEVQVKLHKLLLSLAEKERKVFQMKYYDDLKFREIAVILELKEGTVKTLYYKVVKFIEVGILEVKSVKN
mgnify:CR=1 FL=1